MNYKFLVEIDGIAEAWFNKACIPAGRAEIVEYREGGMPGSNSVKLPGRIAFGNAVLKKGVTASKTLYDWWRQVINGNTAGMRKNIKITLLNISGAPTESWLLFRAWPAVYKTTPLVAEGDQVFIETLELAVERVERQ